MTDYLFELHQLHPIFTLWATSEPELAPILLAIAKAIETNAVSHQILLENVPNYEREYVSYIEVVKNALSRRDSIQIEYEVTVDELAKKRLEKDQVLAFWHRNHLFNFLIFKLFRRILNLYCVEF